MNKKQKSCFDLLLKFKEIADQHHLEYSLAYGTLLGAVREKGFIPWDDDVDLIISEETYFKLMKICPQYMKSANNSDNPFIFPKFTTAKENHEDAPFLDLFIVVQTNNKKLKNLLSIKNYAMFIKNFISVKRVKGERIKNIYKFFLFFFKVLPKITTEKVLKQLHDDHGDKYHIVQYLTKKAIKEETHDRLSLSNCVDVEFEKTKFKAFANYEQILEKSYGKDWKIPKKFAISEHVGLYSMK